MVDKQTRATSKKRVQEFIKMARSMGLKSLKVGEIEFELYPQSTTKPLIDKRSKKTQTELDDTPTDDEFLNWSVPQYAEAKPKK
jgi:hypothetical protein